MREFFKGWKRKAGCVTLVLSVASVSAWIRSSDLKDVVWLYPDKRTLHWLVSSNEEVRWITIRTPDSDLDGLIKNRWRTYSNSDKSRFFDEPGHRPPGFDFGERAEDFPSRELRKWMIVPYWSIALPLIAVSAYLLLIEPQPAKRPESS